MEQACRELNCFPGGSHGRRCRIGKGLHVYVMHNSLPAVARTSPGTVCTDCTRSACCIAQCYVMPYF